MKPKYKFAAWLTAIVAATAIIGCSTTQEAEHREHHPDTVAGPPAAMMSPGTPAGQMAMTDMNDMKAMCEMHKKMMSGKTPEEQKSMMDERMKSMSPEMMKKHMAMMQECK